MRVGRARAREEFEGESLKDEDGLAGVFRDDLDIVPTEAAAPSGAEGFEGCLFGGEARGVVRRGVAAASLAVFALALCEDALVEARRAREHFTYAHDFDNVCTDGNYHG